MLKSDIYFVFCTVFAQILETFHIRDQIIPDLLVGVVVTETANVVSCDVMDDWQHVFRVFTLKCWKSILGKELKRYYRFCL